MPDQKRKIESVLDAPRPGERLIEGEEDVSVYFDLGDPSAPVMSIRIGSKVLAEMDQRDTWQDIAYGLATALVALAEGRKAAAAFIAETHDLT